MRRALLRSGAFVRAARRVLLAQPALAADLEATLRRLCDDSFDPPLRTHRLKGPLAGSWACSAGYDLREVFSFVKHEGSETILLESVGTHDEVY